MIEHSAISLKVFEHKNKRAFVLDADRLCDGSVSRTTTADALGELVTCISTFGWLNKRRPVQVKRHDNCYTLESFVARERQAVEDMLAQRQVCAHACACVWISRTIRMRLKAGGNLSRVS